MFNFTSSARLVKEPSSYKNANDKEFVVLRYAFHLSKDNTLFATSFVDPNIIGSFTFDNLQKGSMFEIVGAITSIKPREYNDRQTLDCIIQTHSIRFMYHAKAKDSTEDIAPF